MFLQQRSDLLFFEAQFAVLIDHLAILKIDLSGPIVSTDSKFLELMGYSLSDVTRQHRLFEATSRRRRRAGISSPRLGRDDPFGVTRRLAGFCEDVPGSRTLRSQHPRTVHSELRSRNF